MYHCDTLWIYTRGTLEAENYSSRKTSQNLHILSINKLLALPFCPLYGCTLRASMQWFTTGWAFRRHQFKHGVTARAPEVKLLLFHDFSLRVLLVLRIFIPSNKVKKTGITPPTTATHEDLEIAATPFPRSDLITGH
jgi:hypothetical protein